MSGDKTEEPTEHKLREARKKGQLAKSQDVIAASIFMIGFFVIYFTGNSISSKLESFIRICLVTATSKEPDIGVLVQMVEVGVATMFSAIMPLCATAFMVALLANYFQVGTLITMDPLKPDIKKLNPISGLKGMFKLKKLIELLKQTFKLTIVSYVAYTVVSNAVIPIILSVRMSLIDSVSLVWSILYDLCVRVGMIFGVIAMFDYTYQKWQFKKDMRMSKKDIKDEYKQMEGDPYIKGQRKQMHQEMSMNDQAQQTRSADAVIVNPHHLAIAIKYDTETMGAPQIVSKGERLWAEKIKEIAKEEGIPILRNVPLAAALKGLDVGDEVPEELYDAVAEILQFVFQLAEERGEVSE